MRYLESERLLIKPVEEEDIYQLLEFRWDKDIMKYLIHDPISKQQQLEWFRNLSKKDLVLSIFLKGEEGLELVGTIGLYNINWVHRLATWRIRLSPVVQGKGIGYEASSMVLEYGFKTLNLHKMQSSSFADNKAIVKLLQKLGCKEEGLLKSHFYNDGEYLDVILFGLHKSDFLNSKAERATK